ncbi:hypothetical protein P0136_12750 [Lentisphaerota bacterium ZTH]|nr:hypothetical protein JYG24_09735 [Lentisphaerota bacterium]WET06226.1 hypothetical protein P0136_12750 [Lentisphaerota bacterium ZTH]
MRLLKLSVFFNVFLITMFCVQGGVQITQLPDKSKVSGIIIDGGQIRVNYADGSSRTFKLYHQAGSVSQVKAETAPSDKPQVAKPESVSQQQLMRHSRNASMESLIRRKGGLCLAHRQRRSLNRIKFLGEDKYHEVQEGEPFFVAKLNSKFYACDMRGNVYEADQQIENNLFNILVPATDYLRALNKELLRMEAMIQENSDAISEQYQENKQLFNDYLSVLREEGSKAIEDYNPKTGKWTQNADISKFTEKSKQIIAELNRRKSNLDIAINSRRDSIKILQTNLGHLIELRQKVMEKMRRHNVKIDNYLKKFPELKSKS